MDYARIYREFIADRLQKQEAARSEYFELHHIVPAALGGADTQDNLIALSASDHFFSHLLLARIHGGTMWSALLLMCGDRWGGRKGIGLRATYSLARREWAAYAATLPGLKGADNGRYDATIYEWVNADTGEKRLATKGEMWSEIGGSRAHWTSAVSRARKTYRGWYVGVAPEIRSNKNKTIEFINLDGREFTGTQKQFCDLSGLSVATASRITRHGAVSVCGWKLKGNDRGNHLALKTRKGTGKTYTIENSSTRFTGKAYECAEHMGVTVGQFNSGRYSVERNPGKSYKGWSVYGAAT